MLLKLIAARMLTLEVPTLNRSWYECEEVVEQVRWRLIDLFSPATFSR